MRVRGPYETPFFLLRQSRHSLQLQAVGAEVRLALAEAAPAAAGRQAARDVEAMPRRAQLLQLRQLRRRLGLRLNARTSG
jgi:hypothetical protein